MMFFALALATLVAGAQATAPAQPSPALPHALGVAMYVPQRVFDTRRQAFTDFEVMLADLARADVIFVGEQHDDPNTHRLESALLEGLRRRNVSLVVSLEMFERDVQETIDAYMAGSMSEEDFLKTARPWPRYATDYRPLVELAKAHAWPVVAANVPRRYASEVSKNGRTALDRLSPADRAMVAREFQCPADAYFDRFVQSMSSHPAPSAEPASPADQRATTERFYLAQCIKDETMAESIAGAVDRLRGTPAAIVHYNGAFHSDFGQGTAERVRRRLPGRRVVVISMLPVESLDGLAPAGEELNRGDYLVYTVKQAPR
jgi:uncharacterized iron-regulated protein